MRAHEFIAESKRTDGLGIGGYSLPQTWVIPELMNQDFYQLYRFGIALADQRGDVDDGIQNEFRKKFESDTTWGEHQIIVSSEEELIDGALKKIGKRGKKSVSTPTSSEIPRTDHVSPLKPFAGYKK